MSGIMETIVMTFILLYPGVFVDIVYKHLAPERYQDTSNSDTMRATRYFLLSGVIALFSIGIYLIVNSNARNGLTELLNDIKKGWNLVLYIGISMLVAISIAIIWRFIYDRIKFGPDNKRNKSNRKLPGRTVWHDLLNSPEVDLKNTICIIRRNGKMIRCGYTLSVPENIQDEKAIVLVWSEFVEETINNFADSPDEEKMIGHLIVDYVFLDQDCIISFYNADKLAQYLASFENKNDWSTSALEVSEVEEEPNLV